MIEYRVATDRDFGQICALIRNEDELFRIYPGGHFPFTVSQLRELARERMELTVADREGKVVGFANLYDNGEGKIFIGNLVVDVSCRGEGIGRGLVQHMLERAYRYLGLEEVCISVFGDNTPALLLYSSMGFSPYDIEERTDPHGVRTALIHMQARRCESDVGEGSLN